MPSTAWAQDVTYTNGFGSDGSYQEATLTTDTYDIDGNGTKDKVYEIENAGQLYWFADKVNNDNTNFGSANAILTTSITVNSSLIENLNADGTVKETYEVMNWTPIGWYDNANSVEYYYSGTFDGNDNTISGLYYNVESSDKYVFAGLFGRSKGTIKNIVVKDSYFGLKYLADYTCRVSGVCGGNSGAIKNCHNASNVTVTINSNYASVGGVCGQNFPEGIIENCNNTGEVNVKGTYSGYGSGGTGGVCGWNVNGTIKGCDNKGEVIGLTNVGGVCGSIRGTGKMQSCYNTAIVSGSVNVGGVCGLYLDHGTPNGNTIESCYNTGKVSGTSYVGGVCGNNDLKGTITNCYYDSGIYTGSAIGVNNGTVTNTEGKTTEQFASGEVCYLLNGGKTDGSQAWYQRLSGEGYPNLNKDAENRTVYGAYKHGETRPTCSNSKSSLSMLHAHAYDSSAIDEANGNHDMSCEQNEQNPYTWTDIDNYSNATAKCNFICSVCNSEVAKDMNVTHNEEEITEPAKCIEKGHNYYVASLTFNNTPYTNYYTQDVPALGHDDSGDVTFNSGKSIYEKVCKRDGCNEVVGYYATSDGSVAATYEDGVYKVDFFGLYDGLAYDNEAKFTVEDFMYTRTFSHDKWVAVYVPFAIDCSQLQNDKRVEMAVINNFHEYEQEDGSYNVVLEVKRKTSGTIPALTPCVMRSMSAPMGGTVTHYINLFNAVFSPAPAADNYIDCSSVTRYYKFTGSLAGIDKYIFNEVTDFVLNEGTLHKANHETTLKAQRWYLSAEDRSISSTSSAAMLRSISINVIGDSDGDVTGIEDIHVVTEKATSARDGIFDLQGRRLNSEPTNGIYIKNGVKYVK